MKHILLPTDFSDNSINAIKYALSLYEKKACTFYLVHTYQVIAYHPGYFQKNNGQQEMVAYKEQVTIDKLLTLKSSLEQEFGSRDHHITIHPVCNSLILGIQEMLQKFPIDLIVMGTKGLANNEYVFLGTHTALCISNIDFPILIVPKNAIFKEHAEILFPTDFKDLTTNKFLENVREFAEDHQSRINILNVLDHDGIEETNVANRTFLKKYFEKSLRQINLMEEKSLLNGIEKFQEDHHVDVLVMVRNNYSFFENLFFHPVIYSLVYHTKIPFLIIPGTAEN